MNLVIGEILFDVFPKYRRLGGAPFNVAFHLKRFGFPVRFISRVGSDPEGEEIREFIDRSGFRLGDLQIDNEHPTGTVRVLLDDKGVPQFEIIADVAYDHLQASPAAESAFKDSIDLIYFGTLIQRSAQGQRALQRLLTLRGPHTQCFYDVNLRPDCFSIPTVGTSLKQADHVKLNLQELAMLQDMFEWNKAPLEFIHHLMNTHSLKSLSLTKGGDGSELFTTFGHFTAPPPRSVNVVDTVGAGDAYAAVQIAGLLQNWHPEKILSRAAEFAARICEIEGAIPADASFYTGMFGLEE